jgi:hypothetical protein
MEGTCNATQALGYVPQEGQMLTFHADKYRRALGTSVWSVAADAAPRLRAETCSCELPVDFEATVETGQRIKSCSRRSGVAFIQIRRPGSADLLRERPCADRKRARGNGPVLLRIGSEWRYDRFRCLLILKCGSVEGALYRHSRNALMPGDRGGGGGAAQKDQRRAEDEVRKGCTAHRATEASLHTRGRLRLHRNEQAR